MALLRGMLEKDPKNRLSAKECLSHPAFNSVLSKSPLVMRHLFNSDALLLHAKMVEQLPNQQEPEGDRRRAIPSQDTGPDRGHVPSAHPQG